MSFELLFDGYERNSPVTGDIDNLFLMTKVKDVNGNVEDRRPPLVLVSINAQQFFRAVIESLSVKYTMFNTMGLPVRAVATIKLKEASQASAAAAAPEGGAGGATPAS